MTGQSEGSQGCINRNGARLVAEPIPPAVRSLPLPHAVTDSLFLRASRNLLCNLFSGSAGVYRPSTDRVVRSHALKHAFSALKHAFFALKHPTARVALANLPCRQVLHAHLNLALSLTLTLISHCYFVVCALTSNVSVPNPNPNPRARCLMLISKATVLKVCSALANKRCWR